MRIKITGINGYVGQVLSCELQKQGHQVSGIHRKLLYGETKYLKEEINHTDVIINLAGASILQRWTKRNMHRIYESRVLTTKNLVSAINELPKNKQPKQIIAASAIGIYNSEAKHDETSMDFDNGFVGILTKDWESAYNQLPVNIDLKIFRIGLVIGKNSKTIKKMLMPFKLGLGGKIGNGTQAFPFIHEKDLTRAISWAISKKRAPSTFNLVAPSRINNSEFTNEFANQLGRPAFLYIPAIILKAVLGKTSSLLLKSPIVIPKALLDNEFEFKYPTIQSALAEILA